MVHEANMSVDLDRNQSHNRGSSHRAEHLLCNDFIMSKSLNC